MSTATDSIRRRSCGYIALAAAAVTLTSGSMAGASTIHVPSDYPTIQEGVDAAETGDTVLVAPGTYIETVVLADKRIRLASHYLLSGDLEDVRGTVIDGGDGDFAIRVEDTVDPDTTITGFTIQNASDGVLAFGRFRFIANWVKETTDGLDYEDGSGGLIRSCLIEDNGDDAVDLDGGVDIVIEQSILRNNDDDGIEVRLHDLPDHGGPDLQIVIRRNEISGNGEDGIQLIDDETLSPRVFTIYRNLILDNAMVGLGMMSDMNTEENFEGADLGERVLLASNTFSGNDHAVTGGDHLISLNNLFVDSTNIALKRATGDSIAAYNLFFGNGSDFSNSNVDTDTSVFDEDPLLSADLELLEGSPAIDAGTPFFETGGEVVLDLPERAYRGLAPDLGANESVPFGTRTRVGYDVDRGADDDGDVAEYGGDAYYVSPTGDDNGEGSFDSPWQSIEKAVKQASYGDTVYMLDGTYFQEVFINDDLGTAHGPGSETLRFVLRSYPGDWAIIDGSGGTSTALRFYFESWAELKNFEVRNGGEAGISLIDTTDTIIENVYSHDNHGSGFGGRHQQRNTYRFCTAFSNSDADGPQQGGDADGFSIGNGESPAAGNRYYRCVADSNSDDGFDSWESTDNLFEESVASNNGLGQEGNGTGFKGGGAGDDEGGPSGGSNTYIRCLAYGNRDEGFTTNSGLYHEGGNTYLNNTAYGNKQGFWAYLSSEDSSDQIHVLHNNLSYDNATPDTVAPGMVETFNSWNLGLSITDDDFQSLFESDLQTTFLRPTPDGILIDQGTDVGLGHEGLAPDLGAFESRSEQ